MKKLISFSFIFSWTLLSISPTMAAQTIRPSNSMQSAKKAEQNEAGLVTFTPPLGWKQADASLLPSSVRIMVIGQGQHSFPPSMNLSMEPYSGTLKQYLRIIKAQNEARGDDWKDLGTIRTEAGPASLLQVDSDTEWGEQRLMHVVLLKNNIIYILTASALKEEFPRFYKEFFASMKSLRIINDALAMVPTTQRQNQLKEATQQIYNQWHQLVDQQKKEHPETSHETLREDVFNGEYFQNNVWTPFKNMLAQQFNDMGTEWQNIFISKVENNLFSASSQ